MAKLKEGSKLVALFTRPLPANRKLRRADRTTHPAEWERFKKYAANDITAMRECVRRMPTWNWDDSAIAGGTATNGSTSVGSSWIRS